MGPYRPLHHYDDEPAAERDDDERVLGWVLLGLGLLRVVPAIAGHEQFGAEATIALVMTALGLASVGRVGSRLARLRRRVRR